MEPIEQLREIEPIEAIGDERVSPKSETSEVCLPVNLSSAFLKLSVLHVAESASGA